MQINRTEALLALNRISGIGTQTLQKFMMQGFEPADWFRAEAKTLAAMGAAPKLIAQLKNFNWRYVEKELAYDSKILTLFDEGYPPLLKTISSPPLVLFVQGDVAKLSLPQIAIIGTRKPTPTGAENAFTFGRALAETGLLVTSGLALGVDGYAHRGALETGASIAVLGTSLDQLYPKRHALLAERLRDHGAVISEFPLETPPLPENFPRRNRIISGLAAGVLVIEAGLKSGSLITAKYALDQGREVFALPGSIHSPVSRGCHYLIKEGARLVENLEDLACILKDLPQLYFPCLPIEHLAMAARGTFTDKGEDKVTQILLNCLRGDPLSVDRVVLSSGLTAAQVSAALTKMTLSGKVRITEEGEYTL